MHRKYHRLYMSLRCCHALYRFPKPARNKFAGNTASQLRRLQTTMIASHSCTCSSCVIVFHLRAAWDLLRRWRKVVDIWSGLRRSATTAVPHILVAERRSCLMCLSRIRVASERQRQNGVVGKGTHLSSYKHRVVRQRESHFNVHETDRRPQQLISRQISCACLTLVALICRRDRRRRRLNRFIFAWSVRQQLIGNLSD